MPLSSSSASLLCPETPSDVASWASDDRSPLPPPAAAAGCPIAPFLAAEADHMPLPDSHPQDPLPRLNAVNWILNVTEFYRFGPLTAFLAVNYLDRFLSVSTLPGQDGGWAMQLLAVACVSVAAKMEETHVPLLSDLQILDPNVVFEPRTVTRMELLLMSSLQWRMRSVTPFAFLHHFADLLPPDSFPGSRAVFLPRAADIIVGTCRVVEFSGYRPSEIAAAAIIGVAREVADISEGGCADLLKRFAECTNEDNVRSCLQLMMDCLIDTRPRVVEPRTPQSPVGVIDAAACGSCDSRRSSSATTPAGDVDPPAKRRRLDESF